MENKELRFTKKALLKNAIPAYLGPFLMSGIPSFFLKDNELMHRSYSYIAIPSLIATVFCFIVLSYLHKKKVVLFNRILTALLFGILMGLLSMIIVEAFKLHTHTFDILLSSIIGGVIVTLMNPLRKDTDEKTL
ncbi:DUF1576 domain-containing protein [Aquimarina longa]|uniref:DUF1576 domain-containing protein n=1 Tax=Aquimarina longa TaxID=1080221 RepID=UPI0007852784|nr:DUF1576 domain-containing protein [Aquimarina longa]